MAVNYYGEFVGLEKRVTDLESKIEDAAGGGTRVGRPSETPPAASTLTIRSSKNGLDEVLGPARLTHMGDHWTLSFGHGAGALRFSVDALWAVYAPGITMPANVVERKSHDDDE